MDKLNISNFVWDDEKVSEMFAIPIGLKQVTKFNGAPLYSSARLQQSFIKALAKSGRTRGAISTFNDLTFKKKKIIPCFVTKGIRGFIDWKIFDPANIKNIMGFYAPEYDRIYILISNVANIFGHIVNDFMAELTIHECVHMVAYKLKSGFFNLYSNELIAYYTTLWSKIFQFDPKELSPAKAKPIILYLSKEESSHSKMGNTELIKYHKMLTATLKDISKLDDTTFEKMLNDYIILGKIYLTRQNVFFQVIQKFNHIISPMYGTYKEVFGLKNLTTICVQELIYPSEIIAIISESRRHTGKALKGIKKLL